MPKKYVNVLAVMPEELDKALTQKAAALGASKTQVVRFLIEELVSGNIKIKSETRLAIGIANKPVAKVKRKYTKKAKPKAKATKPNKSKGKD